LGFDRRKFGPWWAEQTVEARNAWLRSAGVRVEFDREQIRVEFGDLQTMLRELSPGESAKQWRDQFEAMKRNGIAGMEMFKDRVVIHGTDGRLQIYHLQNFSQRRQGVLGLRRAAAQHHPVIGVAHQLPHIPAGQFGVTPTKTAGLTPISNELAEDSTPAAVDLIAAGLSN
jgi:hypothetical protein